MSKPNVPSTKTGQRLTREQVLAYLQSGLPEADLAEAEGDEATLTEEEKAAQLAAASAQGETPAEAELTDEQKAAQLAADEAAAAASAPADKTDAVATLTAQLLEATRKETRLEVKLEGLQKELDKTNADIEAGRAALISAVSLLSVAMNSPIPGLETLPLPALCTHYTGLNAEMAKRFPRGQQSRPETTSEATPGTVVPITHQAQARVRAVHARGSK